MLRVGLIGYGGAGRGIHARLIRAAGQRVTVVVTRSPQRRAAAAADWPGVRLLDDVAGLVTARAEFDVVVVAGPSGLHVAHGEVLTAAGIPFLLDKPMATDAGAAARLLRAAGEAGVPFTVFQNRRWDPEQLTLRAVLDRGDLGEVHTFERRWERWRPVPQDRWKETDPVGGGLLLDLGTHLVDSATQLFGRVVAVSGELRALTTPTEDDVFLVLHHAGGVVSRLWAGSVVGAPGPRTRVLGRAGAFLVTRFEADESPWDAYDDDAPAGTAGWIVRGSRREPVATAPGGHEDFYPLLEAWLRGRGPVPVDPAECARTAEVLDAARTSHGSLVRL